MFTVFSLNDDNWSVTRPVQSVDDLNEQAVSFENFGQRPVDFVHYTPHFQSHATAPSLIELSASTSSPSALILPSSASSLEPGLSYDRLLKLKPSNRADGQCPWWDTIHLLNTVAVPQSSALEWNWSCPHCGVAFLSREPHNPSRCFVCGPNQAHLLPKLPEYPAEWSSIVNDKQFSPLSRKLNNIFCLAGLGVFDGDFMTFDRGVSSVTLDGGRTYHRMLPSDDGDHAIRWFIHDSSHFAVSANALNIPDGWADTILSGLREVNPYIDALEQMSHNDTDLALHLDQPETITGNEVAAIVSFRPAAKPTRRKVVIQPKNSDTVQFLDILSPLTEPLHYPLLFPHGTLGWSSDRVNNAGKKFTQMRWFRSRIYSNAMQLFKCGRLMGEYVVDAFSMIEEARLEYIRHNQHLNEVEDGDPDSVDDYDNGEFALGDDEPVPDVRLPSSFIHSPAWCASQVSDCLALHKYGGPVTFFITMTCNPDWPEITSQLLPGQTAADRPDVVVRVYQQKYLMLLDILKNLFGPVVYLISVREFQKRGLPHNHIGICLRFPPRNIADIDKILSVELPREEGPLRYAVKKFMTHSHNPTSKYHRCGWSAGPNGGSCKYGYPKPVNPTSYFDERGYFHSRRRNEEDEWTVQHIPFLIALFQTHIDVEFSQGVTIYNYLFKYLYKDFDEVNWTIAEKGKPKDEIKDYLRARYMSSTEGMTRISGQAISVKWPGVKKLPIHLPGKQRGQMRSHSADTSATLLMRYLDRPHHPNLDNLSYVEFATRCRLAPYKSGDPIDASKEVLELPFPNRPRQKIIFYGKTHVAIARIQMVYPRHGEVFYLRALLMHGQGFRSWADIRTVHGTTYPTFQAAARAAGLFSDENEGMMAFQELISIGASPGQLRWLFCILGADGTLVTPLWERYEAQLSADVRDSFLRTTSNPSATSIRMRTLIYLAGLLHGLGKTLTDLGLPEPDDAEPEVEAERLRWCGATITNTTLCSFAVSLNHDQREIYDHIMQAIETEDGQPIYIDGRAGRGKTYCLYPIIGALRKQDHIVLASASSAFAAKLYPGGRTVHHLYGIPVDEKNPYLQSSIISNRSGRARLLLAATCHIIDEIGGLHFKNFDCADRLMRHLTKVNRVWGGRLLITLGDFRQVAPVIRFGSRRTIVQASIRTQRVFKKRFKILRLTQCQRQANDPDFAAWLDAIGDDVSGEGVDLGRLKHTSSLQEAVEFVFPDEILQHPRICIERAILSPYNESVDEFNARILSNLPGDKQTYYSSDEVEGDKDGVDGQREIDVVATPDLLNALNEPGVPPHELTLAVGAICRFTRNFDASRGLTKNTRVIIRKLLHYSVEVETIPQVIAGQQLLSECIHIPRITTYWQPSNFGFKVLRKQLPLVLSYATSFNGCQGLTVSKLLLDLRRPVFSHGQLYSAMTRVPNQSDVLVLREEGYTSTVTDNIVWPELLL